MSLENSQYDRYSAFPALSACRGLPLLTQLKAYWNLLSTSWACPVLGKRNETENKLCSTKRKQGQPEKKHELNQSSVFVRYVDWIKICFSGSRRSVGD